MTDNTMVEWLRSQILARKAAAEDATQGEWDSDDGGSIHVGHPTSLVVDWVLYGDDLAHVLLQQPQDTIDRCEAELAILDEHRLTEAWPNTGPDCGYGCRICALDDRQIEPEGICRTVRLLARGYRHRPGWNPEWASEGSTL